MRVVTEAGLNLSYEQRGWYVVDDDRGRFPHTLPWPPLAGPYTYLSQANDKLKELKEKRT